MQVQGVVTTRSYCRASCRARPRLDHVRRMPNAIAALAGGFRPCLLCRPCRTTACTNLWMADSVSPKLNRIRSR